MELPTCPNVKEGVCARSDMVHAGESKDGTADLIICRTCKLFWTISKPKTVGRAQYETKIDRMQKATELDRQQAKQKKQIVWKR